MMPRNQPRAFTLIEAVVALALAATALGLLFTVIGRVERTRRDLSAAGGFHWSLPSVFEILEHDLRHAERVRVGENRLHVEGHGALAPAYGHPTHQRAEVRYTLESVGPSIVLVRRQRLIGTRSLDNERVDPVAFDIRRFAVGATDGANVVRWEWVAARDDTGGGETWPTHVRVRLSDDGQDAERIVLMR